MAVIKTTARISAVPAAAQQATGAQAAQAPDSAFTTFGATMNSMFNNFELPSGKRVIVALAAGLIVAGCAGYLAGPLVAYVTAYAAVLTGSAFITFMVQFIAYAVLLLSSLMLGGKVQAFILNGDIDRCYSASASYVRGLFAKKVCAS